MTNETATDHPSEADEKNHITDWTAAVVVLIPFVIALTIIIAMAVVVGRQGS